MVRNFTTLVLSLGFTALPCAAILDQNGDGISDFWEQKFPGPAASPAADPDGDGSTNADEMVAGTHPLDPASRFRLSSFGVTPDGSQVFFQWVGVKGKRYEVERYNSQTSTWAAVASQVAAAAGGTELQLPLNDPSGIFRLRVTDHDADGDGLNGWEEGLLAYSDESPASSGQAGRQDFSAALRSLEGTGSLALADGSTIPKRPLVRDEVARFLHQASFGPDNLMIDHVMSVGIGGWLDEQLQPASVTTTYQTMANNGVPHPSFSTFANLWSMGWWKASMSGADQLRLRMGYALSQILVISNSVDVFRNNSYVQADYYDLLLSHSLGNYRNLLEDVTYSAQMGIYLSHLQNRKSDPSIGRFPDENFAREIMQLFSIGLWELNPDGTRKLDGQGNAIPTYDNGTIMEMAKVFTGFGFGAPATEFQTYVSANDYVTPMQMWDTEHEPGPKNIVDGVVIPAGQTGADDVDDALDALCNHDNIGPFLSRLLIQRFTCSNPSPAYVGRVAGAWADNGSGARGDLKAVLEAILMDPEARTPEAMGDASGMVREPMLRLVAVMRAFQARKASNPASFPVLAEGFVRDMGQRPLFAPSVFNFYLPDHRPAGELRDRGLAAPELEIATSDRLLAFDNLLRDSVENGLNAYTSAPADRVKCNFTVELGLASDPAALVDHLDGLLTWGRLSPATRQAVIAAVGSYATPELRVSTAVYLIADSPDFAILR
jgi:uncharacterized protein (DUF1800 family)